MTEAELIELLFAASALLSGYAVDFTSMVFAYVVAGHFVGRKLTRVQFVALTLVYSAFAAGIAMGVAGPFILRPASELAFSKATGGKDEASTLLRGADWQAQNSDTSRWVRDFA